MRLAAEIFVKHGDVALRLRPSLRAAYRLNDHGVEAVVAGITQCNVGIVADVLAEATDPVSANRFLSAKIEAEGIRKAIASLQEPLLDFVAASFGFEEPKPGEASEGKPVTMEQRLVELFEVGTGWLGWSPAETWAATPAEIIVAQRGLVAKLRAIHGSAEEAAPGYDPSDADISPDELQANLAKLRDLARPR